MKIQCALSLYTGGWSANTTLVLPPSTVVATSPDLSLKRRPSGAGMEPGAFLEAMAGGLGLMILPVGKLHHQHQIRAFVAAGCEDLTCALLPMFLSLL